MKTEEILHNIKFIYILATIGLIFYNIIIPATHYITNIDEIIYFILAILYNFILFISFHYMTKF